jgi:2-amino-4-hydroxy-6-hydroxymethyldihydropteridine diphosphokinase
LPVQVYVAAGSNESPIVHLRAAVAALARAFGPLRCSSVYCSAAVPGRACSRAVGVRAADYLNLVVGFASGAGADAIKRALEGIEEAAGRSRAEPRSTHVTLDLDLALYGRRVDAARGLPHSDILRRTFVLGPLAELAPELEHPVTGEWLGRAWERSGGATQLRNLGSIETLT